MTREQMIEKLRRHSCPSCAMTDDEYAETAGWNSAITAVLAALHAEPPTPARLSPEQHERIDRLLAQGVMDSRITFGEHEAITILLAATEPPPTPTGWQDISTAPKDGTVVLLWATFHEDYGYTERRDGMIRARFVGTRWEPAEGVGQYWHGMTPKLWSPLPAPPPTGADR